jgi:hypothetical protein
MEKFEYMPSPQIESLIRWHDFRLSNWARKYRLNIPYIYTFSNNLINSDWRLREGIANLGDNQLHDTFLYNGIKVIKIQLVINENLWHWRNTLYYEINKHLEINMPIGLYWDLSCLKRTSHNFSEEWKSVLTK